MPVRASSRLALGEGLLLGQAAMADQHLGELAPERQRRVERGRGVLEHDADAPAADVGDLLARLGAQVLAR
jgi:hypothetical protein